MGRLRNAVTNVHCIGVIAAIVTYYAAAFFLSAQTLINAVGTIQLLLGVCVIATYYPVWLGAITDGHNNRVNTLGLGIFYSWLSIVLVRLFTLGLRSVGEAPWLSGYYVFGALLSVGAYAAALHLLAAGHDGGKLHVNSKWYIVASFVAGCVFTYLIVLFQPNFNGVIQSIRHLFR